jgi:hypothetical protein
MTAEQLIRILEKLPDDQKELPVLMVGLYPIHGVGVTEECIVLDDKMRVSDDEIYNDLMYSGAPDECPRHWPTKLVGGKCPECEFEQ